MCACACVQVCVVYCLQNVRASLFCWVHSLCHLVWLLFYLVACNPKSIKGCFQLRQVCETDNRLSLLRKVHLKVVLVVVAGKFKNSICIYLNGFELSSYLTWLRAFLVSPLKLICCMDLRVNLQYLQIFILLDTIFECLANK